VKLHWSPRSPFVRKVMIVLHEKRLLDQVETVRSVVGHAAKPNEAVLVDNPLGKIPALVLGDGTSLFDSPVICEYLDGLGDGARLLPASGPERLRQLRWQALGDGIADILILWRNEQIRDGGPWRAVTAAFDRKLRASFAALEGEAAALGARPFGLGQIAILCAIGQLDFRFSGSNWRRACPGLATWQAEAARRPSVAATMPVDDPLPVAAVPGSDAVSPIDFTGSPS
jgi:glutathione S-transferase